MDRESVIAKLEKEVKKTFSIKTTIYNNGKKVNEDITEHREPGIIISREMADEILALLKEREAQKFFVDESGKITPLPVIVRCKDCKAWKQYDDMNLGKCELYPEYNKIGDWFCNFGERK